MTLSATQASTASFYRNALASKTKAKVGTSFAKLREFQATQNSDGATKLGTTFKNDHERVQVVDDGTGGVSNRGQYETPGVIRGSFKNDQESQNPVGDPVSGASFQNDLRKASGAPSDVSAKAEETARLDASSSMKNDAIASLLDDRTAAL